METTIVVEGLEGLLSRMQPATAHGPMKRFLERSGATIQGASATAAPVDSGRLRSSIRPELDNGSPPEWVKIGPNVAYGAFMEFGTGRQGDPEVPHKSGHWPPGAALDLWASRHGAGSGAAVARAIGKRGGLKPRRYMRQGLENSLADIEGYAQQMGKEIEAALGE